MNSRICAVVSTLGVLAGGIAPDVIAQAEDVTFFVIGKHASYRQNAAGAVEPVDFSFFSEIFLTEEGNASDGVLTLPNGTRYDYADQRQAEGGARDNLLLVSGRARYASFPDLQADYPDGEYRVSFKTPGGDISSAALTFTGNTLPAAPTIRLSQSGAPVGTDVDPGQDLVVGWTPFDEGGPDPNGILDDLIFVILTTEDGVRLAHSGRPFAGMPYLTYADTTFTIPAGSMEAGKCYEVSVEHAILDDTRVYQHVPAMTTRAVTTAMTIAAAGAVCREYGD